MLIKLDSCSNNSNSQLCCSKHKLAIRIVIVAIFKQYSIFIVLH